MQRVQSKIERSTYSGSCHCMWQQAKKSLQLDNSSCPCFFWASDASGKRPLAPVGPSVAVAISCPLILSPSAPQVHSAPWPRPSCLENHSARIRRYRHGVFLIHSKQWCTSKIFTESHDFYSWLLTHGFREKNSKLLTRALPSWKLVLLPARCQTSLIYSLIGGTNPLLASAVGAANSVFAVAGSLYGRVVAEPAIDSAKQLQIARYCKIYPCVLEEVIYINLC